MTDLDPNEIDMIAIEEQARQLRAEALKYGTTQSRSWLRGLVSRLFGGAHQAA